MAVFLRTDESEPTSSSETSVMMLDCALPADGGDPYVTWVEIDCMLTSSCSLCGSGNWTTSLSILVNRTFGCPISPVAEATSAPSIRVTPP
ncbi:unnamed protein product [Lasius platythorax]|uniref:Uncharacterized protein n=1 Tax=Lasius platythorax TaxID=488582 RepID=A0AAV2MZN0_9HYME